MSLATKKELRAIGNAILMRKSSWKNLGDWRDIAIREDKYNLYIMYHRDEFFPGYYVGTSLYKEKSIGKLPFSIGRKILKERNRQRIEASVTEKEIARQHAVSDVFNALGLGGKIDEPKK